MRPKMLLRNSMDQRDRVMLYRNTYTVHKHVYLTAKGQKTTYVLLHKN